ncbi:MAG: 4Fe-4S binding protein [Nitrospirota bacterium]|nr:MAG: 4Fe-4S binding protein [Nitrospirota bacterium]
MLEPINIINGIIQLLSLLANVIDSIPLPHAGVGGGIDALESVDLVGTLTFTAIFVLGTGAVFGIGLAFAAKRFAVQMDPRIEQVKEELAGAHCGACGFAGCQQYAEAVVENPDVSPNLCTPGGDKVAALVAKITGKVAEKMDPIFSRIMCQGGRSLSERRFKYEGVEDCRASILAGGGDKSCVYGCLGYGTCVRSCPFDAMTMSDDNLPLVDITKCTGCRKCEQACPKNVIEVLPGHKAVIVSCHSRDKGGDTRKNCSIGCIACGKCVKVCPFDAPAVENNFSVIDLDKCQVCGLCVGNCPTKAIIDFIPVRPKAFISAEKCIGCGTCMKVCPVDAASGEKKKTHSVDQSRCIGCGICTAKCPKQAIDGTFNAHEVFAKAEAKKQAKEAAAAA